MTTINNQLLAVKISSHYATQGFIKPIMKISPDGEYMPLDHSDYPRDIFISRGYEVIDKQYEPNELFILKSHIQDQEKTREAGVPTYWAEGNMVAPLVANTLLPVIVVPLPDKETGTLERGVKPPEGAFFILDGEYLYGPLKSSYTDDDQYVIEPNVNPLLSYGRGNLGRWLLKDLQSCLLKTEIAGEQRMYVKSFKHLSKFRSENGNSADFIDYLSDDQLIKVANQTYFGKKGLSKKEAEKLQQVITNFEKENRNLQDERLERLKSMLDKYLTHGASGNNLITEYLEAPVGQKFLKDYVHMNESRLLQDVLNEFQKDANEKKQEIEIELDRQRAQLDKYQEEIVKIQDKVLKKRSWAQSELSRIAQETEEERQRKLEENQAELGEKIAQMETELENRGRELESVCERLQIANDIRELKKNYDAQEINQFNQQTKINSLINGYRKAIKLEDDDLYKRIGDMQAFNKLLNGETSAKVETVAPVIEQIPLSSVQPDSASDLIEFLCSKFSDNGRSFSFDEMTNLMVCLQQSFLTILAGGPGTGKTSTVTRLAKAMNLGTGQFGEHFLNVPVGRGWVSSRDMLGFYNSLKDTYQESRSGLYSFLLHHQNQSRDTTKIILLDEANLSSIEHYWSDFLIYCDRENLSLSIDTGIPNAEQRFLKLDDKTRFIATINFDSTTEPLSPRLIDRVPIITLDKPEANIGSETSSLNLDGMLSATKIKDMFTFEDNALLRSEQILLQDTVEILSKTERSRGPAIVISQRKLNAIANYVNASRDLIGSETAMDFAISQFILPHIDGYGVAFKSRLEELADKVSKHSRTESHLERILTSGDYLSGSYSFFG